MASVESWLAAPSTNPDWDEMRRLIEEALENLGEKQRLVFILRHLQGLSYAEIAAILGIAVGTVKSLHFKAIQRIKSLVNHRLEERSHS